MKKYWPVIILITISIISGAYYLLSPLWNVIEVQEISPLIQVSDSISSMTAEEKAEFTEAVEKASINVLEMADVMDPQVQLLKSANFVTSAHEVAGRALLINDNGKKILRFEDFKTINGPNLHIYLASTLGEDDYIDLGPIKATKGSVNYELSEGIDTDRYNKVLVWCVPFKVLFSYSQLDS